MHVNDVTDAQLQLVFAVRRVRRNAAEPDVQKGESEYNISIPDRLLFVFYRSVTPGDTALLTLFSLSRGLARPLEGKAPEALAVAW